MLNDKSRFRDPMPEPLRARRLGETDADAIAEFMRSAGWNANATPDGVRGWLRKTAAQNPFEPGEESPVVGVFVGALLVACLTSIPTRFWNGKESAAAHWLKGFWVLEQYRDGLIGFLLLKEMLKHVKLAASMPAALVPRRLSVALGMVDLGAVRNYIVPLRVARILRKLDPHLLELNGVPKSASVALKIAKFPPVAYAVVELRALQERLCRDAAPVEARAARPLQFDADDLLSQLASPDRARVAGRSPSNDNKVVIGRFSHTANVLRKGTFGN